MAKSLKYQKRRTAPLNCPGLETGKRRAIWSVTVSGNWRVTFRFENGDAEVVNYEDDH